LIIKKIFQITLLKSKII